VQVSLDAQQAIIWILLYKLSNQNLNFDKQTPSQAGG
jgi:hypothetical protein